MDQLMERHRGLFQDLVFDHFRMAQMEAKKLDDELERVRFENDDLTRRLLAARDQISRLQSHPCAIQHGSQPLLDQSTENKENIDPATTTLKSLERDISPPPPAAGFAAPTGSIPSSPPPPPPPPPPVHDDGEAGAGLRQAYDELQARHVVLLRECKAYKNALTILAAKHDREKSKWNAWLARDVAHRNLRSKRRQEGRRSAVDPVAGVGEAPMPSPPTPTPSSALPLGPQPPPSPAVPVFGPLANSGLFSALRPAAKTDPGQDSALPLSTALPEAPSALETTELDQLPLPPLQPPTSEGNDGRTLAPASDVTASDSGDDNGGDGGRNNDNADTTPRVSIKTERGQDNEPVLPPAPPLFQKPSMPTDESGSLARPVVIKSEPPSSPSQLGYRIFEQESFDLDNVGPSVAPSRKRRRLHPADGGQPAHWEPEGLFSLPVPHQPRLGSPQPPAALGAPAATTATTTTTTNTTTTTATTTTDAATSATSPLTPSPPTTTTTTTTSAAPTATAATAAAAATTAATTAAALGSSPPRPPEPAIGQHSTPRPARGGGGGGRFTTSDPKSSRKNRRRSHRAALISVLEDGTDGLAAIPTEASADAPTSAVLDELLTTPPPNPANLSAHTVPPKHRRGGGGGADTPPSAAPAAQPPGSDPLPRKVRADAPRPKPPPPVPTDDDVSAFKVNPAANDGLNYAFHETVRNKEARKCLPGCARACCRELGKFIEAAGLPPVERRGPRWKSSSPCRAPPQLHGCAEEAPRAREEEFVNRYGRHREAFPRRVSPPGFWESEMPDTQALHRQHAEAERIEQDRLALRRREADRGARGRFVRR